MANAESCKTDPSKPCFIFKSDNWSQPNYLGYHDGCNGGCAHIMGYDYWTTKGEPLYAPFDGVVITACAHDGATPPNTVIRIENKETGWTFGALHGDCAVTGLEKVKAGQLIGWANKIGQSGGVVHWHVWFSKNGKPTRNHAQFWKCIGGNPGDPEPTPNPNPKPDPDPNPNPSPNPDSSTLPQWLTDLLTKIGIDPKSFEDLLKKIMDSLEELSKTEFVSPTPSQSTEGKEEVEGKHYEFSVSAQKPGNSGYQHNIRAFFAWPTSGQNLEKFKDLNLEDFEGSYTIPGSSSASVNKYFGSEKYEQGQGMVIPDEFKIGDGVCHSASMLAYVTGDSGLFEVMRDKPDHSVRIPGVPVEWESTVCISSKQYPCSKDLDVRIRNKNQFPVTIHWKVKGDTIEVWTEYEENSNPEEEPPTDQIEDLNLNWPAIILTGLTLLILFFVLKPDKGEKTLIWLADNSPHLVKILSLAWQESKKNALVIITGAIIYLLSRKEVQGTFSQWVEGTTTIKNSFLLLVFILFWINIFITVFIRSKLPSTLPQSYQEKGFNFWWVIIGLLYAVSPLDAGVPIVDDVIVNLITLWLATPKSKRRWQILILAIIILAVVLCAIYYLNEEATQIKQEVWEKIKDLVKFLPEDWQKLIEDFFGVSESPPEEEPPEEDPPNLPDPGSCSLGKNVPNSVSRWCDIIEKYAQKRSIDPNLVAAIIWHESRGNPNAISYCGAVGLMQVIPSDNGGKCGTGFPGRPSTAELKDPDFNVKTGTQILISNYMRYRTWAAAIQHYGPAGSSTYYKLILATWEKFKGGN